MTRLLSILTGSSESKLFALLSAFVVSVCAVEVACLGLSASHVPIGRLIALLILVVGVAAGWATQRAVGWTDTAEPGVDAAKLPGWIDMVIVSVVLVYLIELLIAILFPDVSWDGNMYHFPTIHYWAHNGYVYWIDRATPFARLMNGYPKGAELLGFVLARASGLDNAPNVVNLLLMPMGVLGIACLSRALGASSRPAMLAGLLFVIVPSNVGQMTTTYVDSAYASCAIAALALTALVTVRSVKTGWRWVYAPPVGGAMGLAMAVKPTGLVLTIICVVGLLLGRFVIGRSLSAAKRPRGSGAGFIAIVVGMAILTGGYWYVRNYVHSGSPLYPVGLKIGSHQIFPGWPMDMAMAKKGNTPPPLDHLCDPAQVLYTWAQGLNAWPNTIFGESSHLGGLGFLWILGCVPAVILAWMRNCRAPGKSSESAAVLRILTLLVSLAFLGTPMHWWARYTLWIYALGLPCFAVALHRLYIGDHPTQTGRAWVFVCLGICVMESWGGVLWSADRNILPEGKLHSHVRSLFKPSTWQGDYYSRYFPKFKGTIFDQVLSGSDGVAIGPLSQTGDGQKTCIFGWLSRPLGKRTIVPISPTVGRAELASLLRAKGVRWVLWDVTSPLPPALSLSETPHVTAGPYHLFRADQIGSGVSGSGS